MEMCYEWTMPRRFLIASISSDTARWGCQNFKSVPMEGLVLKRAGSMLSRGKMVKEDRELKVESSIKEQSPAKERKLEKRTGSRGGRGHPRRRASGGEAGNGPLGLDAASTMSP